jgi:hypothetical protein
VLLEKIHHATDEKTISSGKNRLVPVVLLAVLLVRIDPVPELEMLPCLRHHGVRLAEADGEMILDEPIPAHHHVD